MFSKEFIENLIDDEETIATKIVYEDETDKEHSDWYTEYECGFIRFRVYYDHFDHSILDFEYLKEDE